MQDVREADLLPGWGRSPREGNGNPLQYSCSENPMDRGAWWALVYRVAKSWIQLKQPHTQKKNSFIYFFLRGGGFQPVRGLCACGQHAVNFFHLVGVLISAKQLKDIVLCIPLGGTKTLPQAALLFLVCPCLSLHLLPSLISTCLNLPVGTQGRSQRLDEAPFLKTRNGDPERLLCPGASYHPAGFQNP